MKTETLSIQPRCLSSGSAKEFYRSARTGGELSAIRQVRTIALKEFSDRFRSGWVLACVLVWLAAIGLTSLLGLLQIGRIGVQGYERTVISLLNLVQYLVPLLGLLLGHDLLVGEQEERTLRLLVSCGVRRSSVVLGKYAGALRTMCVPLVLGVTLAGAGIGLGAKDAAVVPFVRLAFTSLILGAIFVGIGLALSSLSRTRVQALVFTLLAWGLAVFVFDLVALGFIVSSKAPAASKEIDIICEATHVNTAVDLHSSFDNVTREAPRTATHAASDSFAWLALNPVDLFRAANLSAQLEMRTPSFLTVLSTTLWIAGALGLSLWKLRQTDL